MKFSYREEGAVTILGPQGKIMGGADSSLLHQRLYELIDKGRKKVVIDLSGVDWMNSSGLGILIGSLISLRNNGGDLRLACLNERIRNLLQVTKLDSIFDLHETVEGAIESFI